MRETRLALCVASLALAGVLALAIAPRGTHPARYTEAERRMVDMGIPHDGGVPCIECLLREEVIEPKERARWAAFRAELCPACERHARDVGLIP